jgi:pseudouridine-5'-phosphate glycosidase/pseudouridine kinase
MQSGLLFANPIPLENSIPLSEMDKVLRQAILDAEEHKAFGSRNTPYILKRIRELTEGRTAIANQALVEANVIRGTKVAVELCKIEGKGADISGQ